jgi:hypothetical protein
MTGKALNAWLYVIPLMTAGQQLALLRQAPWLPPLLRRINLIAQQVLDGGRPELLIRRPVFSTREAQVAFLETLLTIDRVGQPRCALRGFLISSAGPGEGQSVRSPAHTFRPGEFSLN